MKNKILITVLAIGLIGGTLATAGKVIASTTNNQNPIQSLVEKITVKFGLKQEDVQAVFDAHRQERQTQRRAHYLTRFDQLVADGKITASQRDLIIAKNNELETKRETEREQMQNMTWEQRKISFKAKKTERETDRIALENWATQNGIDIKYLMGGFGGGFGRHMGNGWFKGMGLGSSDVY